jgi:coproporphyrinogen III oxidase
MEITKQNISAWLLNLQDTICKALELADGEALFSEENWTRQEGGGGRTRIIQNGAVFEKGGVLFSAVEGEAPAFLFNEKEHSAAAGPSDQRPQFYATGVSIVIHPKNPLVPIIHMNVRYFEMDNGTRWLGGGIDLTPHYVVPEDAAFFHHALKAVCDKHHPEYYARFKKWADDYFFITHRKETRGIGGIFFDRLHTDANMSFEKNLAFWKEVGMAFAPTYVNLVNRHKQASYTAQQKEWQLIRRGRYVEFNLVYDKGTKFGLETNGRVESILMSLPKHASWEYDYQVEKGSEEEKTLMYLKKGVDWAGL